MSEKKNTKTPNKGISCSGVIAIFIIVTLAIIGHSRCTSSGPFLH